MLASRTRHVETNQQSWCDQDRDRKRARIVFCIFTLVSLLMWHFCYCLFACNLHCGFQKLLAQPFQNQSCKFETSVISCRFLRQCQFIINTFARTILVKHCLFYTAIHWQYPIFGFISAEFWQCLWILCKMGWCHKLFCHVAYEFQVRHECLHNWTTIQNFYLEKS